ncbi:hypothetical protein HYU12_01445 [Candidatus Woesearchaeota archaeon]|nr:hypothetical protein [Candidatus Woesearchaeota archaeon]
MRTSLTVLAIAAVVVIAFVAINYLPKQETLTNKPFTVESTSSPSSPISVKLIMSAFSETPKLGSETDLSVEVSVHESYDKTLPNATVKIDLPEGIILVSGDTEWTGDLTNEKVVTLNAKIKFGRVGNWTLKSTAQSYFTEDSWYGGTTEVCFSVSEDKISMKKGKCPTQVILPSGVQETRTEPPEPVDESSG